MYLIDDASCAQAVPSLPRDNSRQSHRHLINFLLFHRRLSISFNFGANVNMLSRLSPWFVSTGALRTTSRKSVQYQVASGPSRMPARPQARADWGRDCLASPPFQPGLSGEAAAMTSAGTASSCQLPGRVIRVDVVLHRFKLTSSLSPRQHVADRLAFEI